MKHADDTGGIPRGELEYDAALNNHRITIKPIYKVLL